MSSDAQRIPFAQSKPEDEAGDGLWRAYLQAVKGEDKASVESWNGSTTGILTFTGLFAATVAAFVIESYKMLQPDTGAQTVALLAQLVSATNTTPVISAPDNLVEPFVAQSTAVIVNALWFLSLVISLVCALLATLIQEWTRDFLRDTQRRNSNMTIAAYALNHLYIRSGVERYGLDKMTSVIVALMHAAVAFFLVGLAIFLFPIHRTPALVAISAESVGAFLYLLLSGIPIFDKSCPYRTPLSYVLSSSFWITFTLLFGPILSVVVRIAEHDSWASSLDDVVQGMTVLYQTYVSPSRHLPDHVGEHVVGVPDVRGYGVYDWDFWDARRIMRHERLAFLWQHTSSYILGSGGNTVLLDYLPHQLLDFAAHDLNFFFVYLRHNKPSVDSIVKMMTAIETLSTATGSLRLLQMLLYAEHRHERRFGNYKASRWESMGEMFAKFPIMVDRLDRIHQQARQGGDMTLLVALSSLRWTLLLVRTRLIRSKRPGDIAPLEGMLLCLERIKGFRLLPLYGDAGDGWITLVELKQNAESIAFCHELAARNILTLMAHLVYSRGYIKAEWENYDSHLLKDNVPDMWHWSNYFTQKEIDGPLDSSGVATRKPASRLLQSILELSGRGDLMSQSYESLNTHSDEPHFKENVLERLACLASYPRPIHGRLMDDEELKELHLISQSPATQRSSPHPAFTNNISQPPPSQYSQGSVERGIDSSAHIIAPPSPNIDMPQPTNVDEYPSDAPELETSTLIWLAPAAGTPRDSPSSLSSIIRGVPAGDTHTPSSPSLQSAEEGLLRMKQPEDHGEGRRDNDDIHNHMRHQH